MKSLVEEASSVVKAIEKAWIRAGKPFSFSVKIFEEPQRNFIGLTVKSAKVGIFFDDTPVKDKKSSSQSRYKAPVKKQSEQKKTVPTKKRPESPEYRQRRAPSRNNQQPRTQGPRDQAHPNEARQPQNQRRPLTHTDTTPANKLKTVQKRAPIQRRPLKAKDPQTQPQAQTQKPSQPKQAQQPKALELKAPQKKEQPVKPRRRGEYVIGSYKKQTPKDPSDKDNT